MGSIEQDRSSTMNQAHSKELNSYLLFRVGGELYGCPLLQVREVVRSPAIKPLPESIKHLKGIANLRGYVLSIMDLASRLGIHSVNSAQSLVFVVESVVQSKEMRIGLLVESVDSVVELSQNDIEVPLNVSDKREKKFFLGVAKKNNTLINILNFETLIDEMVASTAS